jgi:hypothetical protein
MRTIRILVGLLLAALTAGVMPAQTNRSGAGVTSLTLAKNIDNVGMPEKALTKTGREYRPAAANLAASLPDRELGFAPMSPAFAGADAGEAALENSPLASLRAWQSEAEDNVLSQLDQAGLLEPAGPDDQALTAMARRLETARRPNRHPEARCRVLPAPERETLVVGHTIIVSRGLLEAVSGPAALEMVLGHELEQMATAPATLDTKYAFGDVVLEGGHPLSLLGARLWSPSGLAVVAWQ